MRVVRQKNAQAQFLKLGNVLRVRALPPAPPSLHRSPLSHTRPIGTARKDAAAFPLRSPVRQGRPDIRAGYASDTLPCYMRSPNHLLNCFLSLVRRAEFYDNRMAAPLFTLIRVLFADDDLLSFHSCGEPRLQALPGLFGRSHPPQGVEASSGRTGRQEYVEFPRFPSQTLSSHLRALCRLFLRPSQLTPPAPSPISRHSKTLRSCSTSLLFCRSSPMTPAGYVPGDHDSLGRIVPVDS
jgi:hypothetical protein